MLRVLAGLAITIALATPAQAQDHAQDSADAHVAQMIENERDLTHTVARPANCPESINPSEIVVCAPDHSDRYRIPSTIDEDPTSRDALRTGKLAPPDVSGLPDCHHSTSGCIGFGRVPPPIYYFDVTSLPMPAPGTDADKIAKGEMRAP